MIGKMSLMQLMGLAAAVNLPNISVPHNSMPHSDFPRRRSRTSGQREKDKAREYGITKFQRQYAKRYGRLDVDGIVQIWKQVSPK